MLRPLALVSLTACTPTFVPTVTLGAQATLQANAPDGWRAGAWAAWRGEPKRERSTGAALTRTTSTASAPCSLAAACAWEREARLRFLGGP